MDPRPTTVGPHDQDRVKMWTPEIARAARTGIDVEDPFRIAALGFRETEWGWALGYFPKGDPCGWGDHQHAFGFLQIDRRFHATFLAEPISHTVAGQVAYACRILHNYRQFLRQTVKDPRDLERATYAAYNAGPRSVLATLQTQKAGGSADPNPDLATTGSDYSAWVFAKADNLRKAFPDLFSAY